MFVPNDMGKLSYSYCCSSGNLLIRYFFVKSKLDSGALQFKNGQYGKMQMVLLLLYDAFSTSLFQKIQAMRDFYV